MISLNLVTVNLLIAFSFLLHVDVGVDPNTCITLRLGENFLSVCSYELCSKLFEEKNKANSNEMNYSNACANLVFKLRTIQE